MFDIPITQQIVLFELLIHLLSKMFTMQNFFITCTLDYLKLLPESKSRLSILEFSNSHLV